MVKNSPAQIANSTVNAPCRRCEYEKGLDLRWMVGMALRLYSVNMFGSVAAMVRNVASSEAASGAT